MSRSKRNREEKARVSITRCGGYDPSRTLHAVEKAVDELGGIDRFVRRSDRVLIKPNLLVGRAVERHVTTHPDVVGAVVRLVKKAGGKPFIGDSPAIGSAERVAAKCGIMDVAKKENVGVVNFTQPKEIENPADFRFKRFKVDQAVLEPDVVINVPKLKTHGQMTVTLGVKNMFGTVPGARKSQWHLAAGADRMHFARMLVDLYRTVSPALTVLDGIIGMHGNGPQNGDPKEIGLIAASEDAVALDAVISEIIGLKRERMPTTLAAEELGVGQPRLRFITVAGESLENCRTDGFVFPETSNLMGMFPAFLRDYLRGWLTTRPVLDRGTCQMCMVCENNCPAQVIARHDDTLRFDLKRCIRCFCCQELCPHGAIRVESGPLARLLRL